MSVDGPQSDVILPEAPAALEPPAPAPAVDPAGFHVPAVDGPVEITVESAHPGG